MPSLHEIEKSFCTLLLNSNARQAFLERQSGLVSNKCTPATEQKSKELEFDAFGVRLYAKLTNYAYHEVMPSIYPGCMQLISDQWANVVNDYLERFPPRHYNLNQSAREFPAYLAKYGKKFVEKFPFIIELADYEWVELEVMEDPRSIVDNNYEALTSAEQFENYAPAVNPTLVVRRYNYAIPTIVDRLAADEDVDPIKARVDIAIFRHPNSNLCKFIELGQTAAFVIDTAKKLPTSYKDLLTLMVAESSDANQAVLQFLELVETLQSLKLFIGSIQIA